MSGPTGFYKLSLFRLKYSGGWRAKVTGKPRGQTIIRSPQEGDLGTAEYTKDSKVLQRKVSLILYHRVLSYFNAQNCQGI